MFFEDLRRRCGRLENARRDMSTKTNDSLPFTLRSLVILVLPITHLIICIARLDEDEPRAVVGNLPHLQKQDVISTQSYSPRLGEGGRLK